MGILRGILTGSGKMGKGCAATKVSLPGSSDYGNGPANRLGTEHGKSKGQVRNENPVHRGYAPGSRLLNVKSSNRRLRKRRRPVSFSD